MGVLPYLFICIAISYLVGVLMGAWWRNCHHKKKQRKELYFKMQIPADVQVTVSATAVVKDSEGNVVNANPEVVIDAVTIENAVGDFGTVVADEDEVGEFDFNPGAAGATGELVVSATVDGTPMSGRLAVELVAGAPAVTELAIELTPDAD